MGMGYEEVADLIRARIESGELAPGARVPSEPQVRADYGVSRDTASKALRLLKEEGLTEGRQGAPTRVRKFQPVRRHANKRLSQEAWGAGASLWGIDVLDEKAEVDGLEIDRIEAPPRIAEALAIPRGRPVLRRSRCYLIKKTPAMYARSYLPADITAGTQIEEPDTGPGGIYARLAELGHRPVRFREEVRSRMPTKAQRELLDIERGTPVILLVRSAMTSDDRVVEINEMVLDSSWFILDYTVEA